MDAYTSDVAALGLVAVDVVSSSFSLLWVVFHGPSCAVSWPIVGES